MQPITRQPVSRTHENPRHRQWRARARARVETVREPDVSSGDLRPATRDRLRCACLPADVSAPSALLAIAESQGVDLTVVGPELPLERGVVDAFAARGPRDRRSDQGRSRPRMEQGLREGFHGAASCADRAFRVCDQPTAALEAIRRRVRVSAGAQGGRPRGGQGRRHCRGSPTAEAVVGAMMVERPLR